MILSRGSFRSEKNDIWAIGCIALQFLSSRSVRMSRLHPYNKVMMNDEVGKDSHLREALQKLIDRKMWDEEKLEDELLAEEAADFIGSCLRLDGERRPTSHELLLHPYLKD
jgi:serine/threonine protein kinase